ncbi:DUF3211 domain-containing protein [Acidianus brierleyi]|uniref:DUF3211 domain-containing protein n=1 Tax=Acidianus brierleyi TaxID=41673 RepID=A0A2U9IIX3_9CREN|nr:DUF3211 domain-containing protein [Acidianus brierleyi]AWR95884.1 DUF3211 domain-containing protein [Acidianus brierleyi]
MLRIVKSIKTKHDRNSLIIILSDPSFILPRIFPPIKSVENNNSSFIAKGKFLFTDFCLRGNVYSSIDNIRYIFTLKSGNKTGNGKLEFQFTENINISFEYDGWRDLMARNFMSKWVNDFLDKLDEDIRMERIRRKI